MAKSGLDRSSCSDDMRDLMVYIVLHEIGIEGLSTPRERIVGVRGSGSGADGCDEARRDTRHSVEYIVDNIVILNR